jgi:hypothetical protein
MAAREVVEMLIEPFEGTANAPGPGDEMFDAKTGGQMAIAIVLSRLPAPKMLALGTRFVPKTFAAGQLESHFAKHAAEWGAGNITKQGYLKRAQDLLSRNVGGDIRGMLEQTVTSYATTFGRTNLQLVRQTERSEHYSDPQRASNIGLDRLGHELLALCLPLLRLPDAPRASTGYVCRLSRLLLGG